MARSPFCKPIPPNTVIATSRPVAQDTSVFFGGMFDPMPPDGYFNSLGVGVQPTGREGDLIAKWALAPDGGAQVYNAKAFGAVGDGVTNDTNALYEAYNSALGNGGGIVFLPPGIYGTTGFNWESGKVALVGVGPGSVLKAIAGASGSVLDIAVGGGGGGYFARFVVDANNLIQNGILQYIPSETSVGTRFEYVTVQNATSYQWVNDGCEDCEYIGCVTPGDESAPNTSVPRSFQLNVPYGACRFVGGELFGRNDINAQLAEYVGVVAGPFTLSPTAPNDSILSLEGCYVYDGGYDVGLQQPIATAGNLGNVIAKGCVFIAFEQASFVNGNLLPGVNIDLQECTFVQGTPSGSTLNIVTASGAGTVSVRGGNVLPNDATVINLFNNVGSASTVVSMHPMCYGVTSPAGDVIGTKNSTLDDGQGNLQAGGHIKAGASGVQLNNFGSLEFLVAGGGSLWNGSGAPPNTLGVAGDYYFRTDTPTTANQRIYVNSAGTWVGIL